MEKRTPGTRRRTLEEWETWVDKAIAEARERGEFDILPGHGKPLHIEESPFAGGREVAFGILKNAGIAPYWVELNKEISQLAVGLDQTLDRARAAARELTSVRELPPAPVQRRRWWQVFRYVEPAGRSHERAAVALRAELALLRRDFLAGNEELNRKIVHYNASIPRDLWQLERTVRPLAQAEQKFDRALLADESPSPEA
jgi:Domain of unknown function (DUF1992)